MTPGRRKLYGNESDQTITGETPSSWQVYIVECADQTLYTGVCTDMQRRLTEHNDDNQKGAKYTRSRRPVTLVYVEACENRSHACRRESAIKALPRAQKKRLIASAS